MFYIKINTGDDFVHVKVSRSLPPFTHALQGVQVRLGPLGGFPKPAGGI